MKTEFELKRIGLKTLDRSGSNLILALFHYHPEFFSLTEKFLLDTMHYRSFPPPFREGKNAKNDLEFVKWLHERCYSMFSGLDGDIKNIEKVKNLVIKIPKEYIWQDDEHRQTFDNSKGPYCKLDFAKHKYDKKLYLIRNPFRVAMSLRPPEMPCGAYDTALFGAPGPLKLGIQPADPSKVPKDMLLLREVTDYTVDLISEYKTDIENAIDSKIIFLEYFLKNFEEELPKVINWADSDAKPNVSPNIGQDFLDYHSCGPGRPISIQGAGGFTPSEEISYKRTINRNILRTFTAPPLRDDKLLSYVENKLGPIAFDYWIHDVRHDYNHELSLDDLNLA